MNCIVTAGPTYETMDNVRRLTNFSTGQLGTELANFLTAQGHEVTLLLGLQATYGGEPKASRTERFTTTADLLERFRARAGQEVGAIFHAAAVSDFAFGKIWQRSDSGEMTELKSGKISTRTGTLLAELVPTPKIIGQLRGLFPRTKITGWKFEVDGDRSSVLRAAANQLRECETDFCVANGPAFGPGFGLVTPTGACTQLANKDELFAALVKVIPAKS